MNPQNQFNCDFFIYFLILSHAAHYLFFMDKEDQTNKQPTVERPLKAEFHKLLDDIKSDSLSKDKDIDVATLIRELKSLLQHKPRVPLMEYSTFDSV